MADMVEDYIHTPVPSYRLRLYLTLYFAYHNQELSTLFMVLVCKDFGFCFVFRFLLIYLLFCLLHLVCLSACLFVCLFVCFLGMLMYCSLTKVTQCLCNLNKLSLYTLRKMYPKVVSKGDVVGSWVKLYTAMVE